MANYPTNTTSFEQNFNYAPFPPDRPVALPLIALDFTLASSYTLDLLQLQQFKRIGTIQSVYADNSANTSALNIQIQGTSQSISFPPGSQGYLPLLVMNPAKLVFSSTGSVKPYVALLNTLMAPIIWFPAGGASAVSISGVTVANGALNTTQMVTGSGGTLYPTTVGNLVTTGVLTASGASATLITGAPGYFVSHIRLEMDPRATQAVAGTFEITVNDSSFGTIFAAKTYVPSAAITPATVDSTPDETYSWWNNKVANSTLSITLPAALTAGNVRYTINYGIAAFVG